MLFLNILQDIDSLKMHLNFTDLKH